jgi:hypothetical protein
MDQLDEPLLARPALAEDLDVDVAIIGAGYTGLWTAYYLKRQAPGLKIAIIEAQTAGFGASGRNGGWLMGNLLGEDRLLAGLSPEQRRASMTCCTASPMKWKSSSNAKASTAITAKAGCCTAPPATPNRKPACASTWTRYTSRA